MASATFDSPYSFLLKRMDDFLAEQCLASAGEKIVVGVSGGSDSVALLHMLSFSSLNLGLFPVYIDHGLRPAEIPGEISLLSTLCKQLHLTLQIKKIDVHSLCRREKRSTEEGARILRYQAFRQLCAQCGAQAIAVAHTADDQVEEFFLRIIRGTGLKGMTGMLPRNKDIIRPLLNCQKEELRSYLREKGLVWCEDSSNSENRFLRNRIRNQLLPLVRQEFNPSIDRTIVQLMQVLDGDEDYLAQETKRYFEKCVTRLERSDWQQLKINRHVLNELHTALQRRILEQIFVDLGGEPTFQRIEDLRHFSRFALDQAKEATRTGQQNENSEIHLGAGIRAQLQSGELSVLRLPKQFSPRAAIPKASPLTEMSVHGPGCFRCGEFELIVDCISRLPDRSQQDANPGKLYLDGSAVQFPLTLRSVKAGDKVTPAGRSSKKVGKLLAEKKIPPASRVLYPVLLQGNGEIVAVAGICPAEGFAARQESDSILSICWQRIPTADETA